MGLIGNREGISRNVCINFGGNAVPGSEAVEIRKKDLIGYSWRFCYSAGIGIIGGAVFNDRKGTEEFCSGFGFAKVTFKSFGAIAGTIETGSTILAVHLFTGVLLAGCKKQERDHCRECCKFQDGFEHKTGFEMKRLI